MKLIKKLEKDIAFLTSSKTAGRLSGTEGAHLTANYLADELASAGFETTVQGSYFQELAVPVSYLTGKPYFQIGGEEIKFRQDFTAVQPMSTGGNFSGPLLVVTENDSHSPEELKGKIVLISGKPKNFSPAATARLAVEMGVLALILNGGKSTTFFKTSYHGKGILPILRVRSTIFDRIEQMQGEIVKLKLPLERGHLPCKNVLGLKPGTENEFTLALTAHFDHVGDDPGGARFPGAMDNAAGVAAVLAAANRLAETPLPINLLIAFLTGEESGLVGAKYLIQNPPLPISAVINLDVIGREPQLNALRVGHAQRGDWFAELAASVIERQGIEPIWKTSGSDGSAFLKQGYPTIGLMEQPKNKTRTGMHVPTDTMENLYIENIAQSVDVLVDMVQTLVQTQVYNPMKNSSI